MSDTKLNGVFAPVVTPFKEQNIVYPALQNLIERYNETDLLGYMPLGSNGEFQGLTEEESLKVLSLVMKTKKKDKVVVAGCGRESAFATVEFIKKTADLGLDMAFVLAPHYFADRMTDDALLKYFTYVADLSPVPIVVYNAPKFASGLMISTDLMRRFAPHPNIIAMKNSSLQPNTEYFAAIPEGSNFYLIAGNIKTFYAGLSAGAAGGVLSTASYLPECCCRLYRYFRAGETRKAEKLSTSLCSLSAHTIGRFGVAGVKLGLKLRGIESGEVRLPLLPVPDEKAHSIAAYFNRLGIFETELPENWGL